MHKKTRTYLIVGIVVAALAALLLWAFAPRPTPVELATASVGPFEATIEEDGRTRVRDRYVVSAPLAGRLSRIALREGDAVAQDAVVATLAPTLAPMLDARTERELATRVEAADAMVARASTRVERARVALQQARNTLRREEGLAAQRFVATIQIENDRLAVRGAEQELASAEQDRHVAGHELEQAKVALATVRNPDDTDGFALRAPVAGRVLRVLQPSATTVAIGTPLLEIGDVADIEVVAELLTTDALRATPGTPVRIERWGGPRPLQGRVRLVEPAAFTKISALGVEEQRVNVLIDILGSPEQWRALGDGYRVGVRVVALAAPRALQVPVSAVFPRTEPAGDDDARANAADAGDDAGDLRMAAFVVRDGRARLTPVLVRARNGSTAWIVAGLDPGDRVIVYPGDAVHDDARVEARPDVDGGRR